MRYCVASRKYYTLERCSSYEQVVIVILVPHLTTPDRTARIPSIYCNNVTNQLKSVEIIQDNVNVLIVIVFLLSGLVICCKYRLNMYVHFLHPCLTIIQIKRQMQRTCMDGCRRRNRNITQHAQSKLKPIPKLSRID